MSFKFGVSEPPVIKDKEKAKIFIAFCFAKSFKLISWPFIVDFTLSITSFTPSCIKNFANCKTFGFLERKNKAVPAHISNIPKAKTIKFDNKWNSFLITNISNFSNPNSYIYISISSIYLLSTFSESYTIVFIFKNSWVSITSSGRLSYSSIYFFTVSIFLSIKLFKTSKKFFLFSFWSSILVLKFSSLTFSWFITNKPKTSLFNVDWELKSFIKVSSKMFLTFLNCLIAFSWLDKSLFVTLILAKLHAYTNLTDQLYSGSSSSISSLLVSEYLTISWIFIKLFLIIFLSSLINFL